MYFLLKTSGEYKGRKKRSSERVLSVIYIGNEGSVVFYLKSKPKSCSSKVDNRLLLATGKIF